MSAALLIDVILWASVAGVGYIAWRRGPKVMTASLREGTWDFIGIVPRIAVGVIGSGYIAAVIPQEIITGWLGPNSGWLGVATAVVAGAATPGGPGNPASKYECHAPSHSAVSVRKPSHTKADFPYRRHPALLRCAAASRP